MDDYSIVEIFDEPVEGHRCGYCKSDNGSLSYGMWAHSLTIRDYQNLIDRGWRRSGKYCYKPLMQRTCCPLYTIKCVVNDIQLSKSHKKVLRRMHHFLTHGDSKEEKATEKNSCSEDGSATFDSIDVVHVQSRASLAEKNMEDKKVDKSLNCSQNAEKLGNKTCFSDEKITLNKPSTSKKLPRTTEGDASQTAQNAEVTEKLVVSRKPKQGHGPDPNKPPCKKAKLLRMERKLGKLNKNQDVNTDALHMSKPRKANIVKTLEEYLSEPLQANPAHRLEIRLVPSEPPSAEFDRTFEESYAIYKKYQMTIHNDPPDRCSSSQFKRFLIHSPLEEKKKSEISMLSRHIIYKSRLHSKLFFSLVKLLRCWPRSADFKATSEESFEVYRLYQQEIHNETEADFDKNTFYDFLVNSPLEPSKSENPEHPGYGSFHQQYWLDNKLIAVGVIDILPNCVSSVYFYYDPKYSFLSLGTYAALREIAFTRELSKLSKPLQFYYMGFYIHTCQKMRYKGQYTPSLLLCPEAYTWHPIEKAKLKLETAKYSRLEESNLDDEDGKVNIGDVVVLYKRSALPYYIYCSVKRDCDRETDDIMKYARMVGKKCVRSLLLYRG